MGRTQKAEPQKDDEYSEFDSQESQDSAKAQAEKRKILLAAFDALEKKEKAKKAKSIEKQTKFLNLIDKHLNHDLTKATDMIERATKAIETEYNTFLSKYTAQENKIHNLWTQIRDEQANLVDTYNKQYQLTNKAVVRTASAHLTALSNTNSACNESRKMIDSLIPPSYSDSDSDWDMTDGDY